MSWKPSRRERSAGRDGQGDGGRAHPGGGKRRLGLPGLLELIDQALQAGWPLRRACNVLNLNETRTWRWMDRRQRGELADKAPGGNSAHGILTGEVTEIVALFHEWGQVNRSHRMSGRVPRRVDAATKAVRKIRRSRDGQLRRGATRTKVRDR